MPIKGMTNRPATNGRLPEAGKLRKGGEKTQANKPGPDLQHFRFTSDNAKLVERFEMTYGQTPDKIVVYLPYATTDGNWSAWIEKWDAGGRLIFRGDGEKLVKHMVNRETGEYSFEQISHPTVQKNGKEVPDGAHKGRLTVQIPALKTIFPVTLTTGSIFDILWLDRTLRQYEATFGDLRGIPFVLRRVKRPITRPGPGGKRLADSRWLVELEPDPTWVENYYENIDFTREAPSQADMAPSIDPETGEILDVFEDADAWDDDEAEETPITWPDTGWASADALKAHILGIAYETQKTGKPEPAALKKLRADLQKATNGDAVVAGAVLASLFGVKSSQLTAGQVWAIDLWLSESKTLAADIELLVP